MEKYIQIDFSVLKKMAAKKKRAADNYLTHDNWDNDEDSAEPEVGT